MVDHTQNPHAPSTELPRLPLGAARRAMSVDVLQPSWTAPLQVRGRGRDLRRDAGGALVVAGRAWFDITVDRDEAIVLAADGSSPERLGPLVGVPAVVGLRRRVAGEGPGELLTALLDDLPSAVRLSTAAPMHSSASGDALPAPEMPPDGVCVSWGPGTWLRTRTDAGAEPYGIRPPAPPWEGPDGPWDDPVPVPPWGLRRERRIDLRTDSTIETAFRDVLTCGDGSREVVHEYGVRARLAADGTVHDVVAEPRVLPSPDCPAAATTASAANGWSVRALREDFGRAVDRPVSCTHLTDALRSLGDLQVLATVLLE